MLTDALAQYLLIWKQWRRLAPGGRVAPGGPNCSPRPIGGAAKKFGAKIIDERVYQDTGGGRRSDSGSVQGSAADAGLHPERARIRRARRSRRKRGFCRLSALSHLGIPGRSSGSAGIAAGELGPLAPQILGRGSIAKTGFQRPLQARHECARQPGLGRHALDRRRRRAHQIVRPYRRSTTIFCRQASPSARSRDRGLRCSGLEPAAASVNPAHRWPGHRSRFRHRKVSCIETSELDTLGLDRPETKCKLQRDLWRAAPARVALLASLWRLFRVRPTRRRPTSPTRRAIRSRSSISISSRSRTRSRPARGPAA